VTRWFTITPGCDVDPSPIWRRRSGVVDLASSICVAGAGEDLWRSLTLPLGHGS